jgi:hypothetical protein
MTHFCTPCTEKKDRSPGVLPAVQRYNSRRLKSVFKAAESLELGFLILSGEYGILEANDPIPYYEHLLLASEVPEHSKLVHGQLEALGVSDLIFFTGPLAKNENLHPYMDCLKIACGGAGIDLKFVEVLG